MQIAKHARLSLSTLALVAYAASAHANDLCERLTSGDMQHAIGLEVESVQAIQEATGEKCLLTTRSENGQTGVLSIKEFSADVTSASDILSFGTVSAPVGGDLDAAWLSNTSIELALRAKGVWYLIEGRNTPCASGEATAFNAELCAMQRSGVLVKAAHVVIKG
jgi:hypothetical protein